MLAQERYEKILELLEKDRSVKVSMLTKLFNVSIETVRRDLEYLEKEGHLKRVYGGAVLEKINNRLLSFENREKESIEEKKEIAKIAMDFIKEGQSIAIHAGTTNLEIARELKKNFKQLTVLTNSLSIFNELSDMEKYTLILTGGIFKKDEFSLVGTMAENNITQYRVDTAFISPTGVSLSAGLTDYLFDEINIMQKSMEISHEVIVLADSSKFDAISLVKICDLEQINVIITDSKLKKNILDKYLKNGIEVVNKRQCFKD